MKRYLSFFVTLVALSLVLPVPEATAAPRSIRGCQTIGSPGSYVLVRNLTATGDCLVVNADHVTIELQGFVMTGNGTGSGVTDNGVPRTGIVLRNGTIRQFETGISFPLNVSTGIVLERIRAVSNTGTGIRVGSKSAVRDCVADSNGGNGIEAFDESIVSGSTATGNTFNGILVGIGSTVTGNVANANGIDGIIANAGSTVSGNTARGNGDNGLDIICPSNVIGNTALANTGINLVALGGCNSFQNLAP